MKVGVTIEMSNSFFSKGINQNALYLSMVYRELGHKVYLITGNENTKGLKELKELDINDFEIVKYSESLAIRFDLIISLGIILEKSMYSRYKSKNPRLKYVSYKCGNEFFIDTEMIIYGTKKEKADSEYNMKPLQKPDAIWCIPQMENTNLEYYSFLLRQKNSTVVPFVWDPIFIEASAKNINLQEWSSKNSKNIAVMEPNISIMKNLLHPIVSVDRYVKDGNSIDKLILYSSNQLATNKRLLTLLKNSNPSLIKKISALSRYPTPLVLKEHADVVLSWQLENNLNYLYFDIAWLGWPIIHNANLCKDVGYYYKNQLASEASKRINEAFNNHDSDYKKKQRSIIKRFTVKNTELLENYRKLTNDVMSNNFKQYKYNSKDNSIYLDNNK